MVMQKQRGMPTEAQKLISEAGELLTKAICLLAQVEAMNGITHLDCDLELSAGSVWEAKIVRKEKGGKA